MRDTNINTPPTECPACGANRTNAQESIEYECGYWLGYPNSCTRAFSASVQLRAQLAALTPLVQECAEVLMYCRPYQPFVMGTGEWAEQQRQQQDEKVKRYEKLRRDLDALTRPAPAGESEKSK